MLLIRSTHSRKHCGRLDLIMCVDTKHKQTGKASLADIFFQKLFGKRRACQNERMAGYMTIWKAMWLYGRLCGCPGDVAVCPGDVAVWLGSVAVWLGYVAAHPNKSGFRKRGACPPSPGKKKSAISG